MPRVLLAVALLAASAASAREDPTFRTGTGRISIMGGWHYTPNDYFLQRAAEKLVPVKPNRGGPHALGTFAYAASDSIEVAIDLFASSDNHDVPERADLVMVHYGALLGARVFWALGSLTPNVGFGIGPSLVYVGGLNAPSAERVITSYAACAGLTWQVSDTLAATVDLRWLLARGYVPAVGSGINAGGGFASIGLTWIFPPDPDRAGAVR
ncbi:MAG: hypothetical protein IRZ16_18800 [Myxococcaceae bacterium]|nr:hypothetical protein [Myxococcaceae bacterium]